MFTNLAIKNRGLTLYHADRACRANLRGVHLKKLRAGPTEIQFPQLCLLIYIQIRWFIGSPSYVKYADLYTTKTNFTGCLVPPVI